MLVFGSYGVSLWKYINKGGESFREHIRFVVGSSQRISLWHDRWCGDRPLCCSFPIVYSLSQFPHARVADCLEVGSTTLGWSV